MKKKLTILFLCVAGVLVVMIGRLGFIEVKSGERYEKIVLSNQEYGSTHHNRSAEGILWTARVRCWQPAPTCTM